MLGETRSRAVERAAISHVCDRAQKVNSKDTIHCRAMSMGRDGFGSDQKSKRAVISIVSVDGTPLFERLVDGLVRGVLFEGLFETLFGLCSRGLIRNFCSRLCWLCTRPCSNSCSKPCSDFVRDLVRDFVRDFVREMNFGCAPTHAEQFCKAPVRAMHSCTVRYTIQSRECGRRNDPGG
jgi:hypothetical protein